MSTTIRGVITDFENEINWLEGEYPDANLKDLKSVYDNLVDRVNDLESWNNEAKDVASKMEGSEHFEPILEELNSPLESMAKELY